MKLLNEIDHIKSIMGVINEKDDSRSMNVNLKKTVETLNYLK